ncbi:hypothetical protein [Pseudomonas proteolytica]|jgi:hypothetical protein|uniref:hypothetical protein n=1 Tax=Pseudomonas proteolytica TaxID=219574 RepID=UPI00089951E5|nr:hypothetical protein [Pseudomonas proteolytica]KAA8699119.1 hypothetical protein F4W61_22125 [Pseudomonas proteolytica]TWR75857.1 hypothetical protein FIV38_24545 [Pseudomonas proteolytica]SED91020.1 hypothetical protein SAMN04490200_2866 [Pseudomonas proteolytica]
MKLDIQLSDNSLTVQGQPVTKAYAEGVMLAGLIAAAGKNQSSITAIVRQYIEAGLSTSAFPEQTSLARQEIKAGEDLRAAQLRDAQFHADRCASYQAPTRLEVARAREAKEKRAADIRAHGAAIRAARRN